MIFIHQEDLSITLSGARKRIHDAIDKMSGIELKEHMLQDGKYLFVIRCGNAMLCDAIEKQIRGI